MKINTSINILIIFIILNYTLWGFALFGVEERTIQGREIQSTTEELTRGMFELSLLTNEFLLYKGVRSQQQWQIRHDSIRVLLEEAVQQLSSDEQETLLLEIQEDHQNLNSFFLLLTSNPDNPEIENKIASQMLLSSQELVVKSIELSDRNKVIIEQTRKRDQSLIFFFLASQGFILIGLAILLKRSISKPIEKLKTVAESLEKGNFKTRINIKDNNEFDNLGKVFNHAIEVLDALDKEKKQIEQAKNEFLSITSHELKSPLTPIKAQLQMLQGKYYGTLNVKQKDALEIIMRNTNRLELIIQDLLDISKIEAAKLKFRFSFVEMKPFLKAIAEDMRHVYPEKNIRIITKISSLPDIEIDPDRVMQVLRNLLDNAMKFSHHNGKIVLSAELKKSMVEISVKDYGIGIEKENLSAIFRPFFQEEQTIYRTYGGTGLGLALCKGIVESQKGKLWVKSEKGKGSTFTFTLPLKPIKNVKPINLLFSSEKIIEEKIKNLLINFLGPLGETEFELLLDQDLSKKNCLAYLDVLKTKKIITSEKYYKMRKKIKAIFSIGKTE